MDCNLRLPEARQFVPALIQHHAKFEVAEPYNCRIVELLLYVVNLTFNSVILTFYLWP